MGTTVLKRKKREYPTIYMMVGIPYSEKEEIAKRLTAEFYPVVFGDKNLPRNALSIFEREAPKLDTHEKVCAYINKEAYKALKTGREVLIKSELTSTEEFRNLMLKGLIDRYRTVAVYADTPLDICESRMKRARLEETVDLTKLKQELEAPKQTEGYDDINHVCK